MLSNLKLGLTAGVSALVLAGCATQMEPDPRLDEARAAVAEAEASGMAASEPLKNAQTFLAATEENFEEGDADDYERTLALTQGYAALAVARGKVEALESRQATLESELAEAKEAAATCAANMEAMEAELAEMKAEKEAMEITALGEALGASKIAMSDTGANLTLQSFSFASGSASLGDHMTEPMNDLKAFLLENPDMSVKITGHTDAMGAEDANMELSQKRAEAVAGWLVENGIDAARIETAGAGESEPIASNDTPSGRKANRRVELSLMRDASM